MKCNIVVEGVRGNGHQSVDLQLIDYLYAFYQSKDPNFDIHDTDFCISTTADPGADINILFSYFPSEDQGTRSEFDLIFVDNSCESFDVMSRGMVDSVEHDRCYMITGCILDSDHYFYKKNIMSAFAFNTGHVKTWWQSAFYPHSFELNSQRRMAQSRQGVAYINGQNRSWRHYVLDLVQDISGLHIHRRHSQAPVMPTLESLGEGVEDSRFRILLSQIYPVSDHVPDKTKAEVFDIGQHIGLDGKFGYVRNSVRFLPLYFEHHFVCYPETCFYNDVLSPNEKFLKCVMAETMPFPIGGRGVNRLYNKLGFQTAWNLLPNNLQWFDSESNHEQRFQGCRDAIAWLTEYAHTIDLDQYKNLVYNNLRNFLYFDYSPQCELLDKLIAKHSR